jgi:hypothetical protein
LASRIRLADCALHLRAVSVSRHRDRASPMQSADQLSASTYCAASRPSAAVIGCNETTPAIAAWYCCASSSGLSPVGGNEFCKTRRISRNAACGKTSAQSGFRSIRVSENLSMQLVYPLT